MPDNKHLKTINPDAYTVDEQLSDMRYAVAYLAGILYGDNVITDDQMSEIANRLAPSVPVDDSADS